MFYACTESKLPMGLGGAFFRAVVVADLPVFTAPAGDGSCCFGLLFPCLRYCILADAGVVDVGRVVVVGGGILFLDECTTPV